MGWQLHSLSNTQSGPFSKQNQASFSFFILGSRGAQHLTAIKIWTFAGSSPRNCLARRWQCSQHCLRLGPVGEIYQTLIEGSGAVCAVFVC